MSMFSGSDKSNIAVREACLADIPAVLRLLKKYHTNSIDDDDRKDGFVTTNINAEELGYLVTEERGLVVAVDRNNNVVGFVIAGSWSFLQRWPMFDYMQGELGRYQVEGVTLTPENCYQYGPICVDKSCRGEGVAERMFTKHCDIFRKKFMTLVTFVNENNPRSMRFHSDKIGLTSLDGFEFNGNNYRLLVLGL